MKKSITYLLLLAALGLISIAYFAARDGGRSPLQSDRDAELEASLGAPSEAAEKALDLTLSAQELSSVFAQREQLPSASRIHGDRQSAYLSGRVKLPRGAPPDPTLRVLALATDMTPLQIYGSQGLLAQLGSSPSPSNASKALLACSQVAADGSFGFPLPPHAEQIWLVLDGRYLYLSEAQHLKLPAGDVELTPLLGGYLRVEVRLPEGPHGPDAPGAEVLLTALKVRLQTEQQGAMFAHFEAPWSFERLGGQRGEAASFEFRALPVNASYLLQVESPTLENFERAGINPEAGRELNIDAPLRKGLVVRGVVLDPDGVPLADAKIEYSTEFSFGVPSNLDASALSVESGEFRLIGLGPKRGLLSAIAGGFRRSRPRVLDLASSSDLSGITLQLQRGASLRGRVRFPDGSPAAAARIVVAGDGAAMGGLQAFGNRADNRGQGVSDGQGGFGIHGLADGPFEVSASLPSRSQPSVAQWFTRRSGIKADGAPIELVLEQSSRLVGYVHNAEGTAQENYLLRVEFKDASLAQAAFTRQLTGGDASRDHLDHVGREPRQVRVEHEQGEFVLEGLCRGTWSISASAEGLASSEALELVLPEAALEAHVIRLHPEAILRGSVSTPTGDPIGGAEVSLQLGRAEIMAGGLGQRASPRTQSDQQGHFELKQLAPGPQAIVARHPDYASSVSRALDPVAGESLEDMHLTLRLGGSIRGLVYGSDGQPEDGVQVIVQNPAEVIPLVLKTRSSGSFHFQHLSPGTYQVTAIFGQTLEAGENALVELLENMQTDRVEVFEGQEAQLVLGKRPDDPLQVGGRVTHHGQGLAGALVSFLPEGSQGFSRLKIATTKADGSYSSQLDAAGPYMISVQLLQGGPGQQQQIEHNREITKGANFDLDIALPGARISGRLEDSMGRPLANLRVSLSIDGAAQAGTLMGGQFAELTSDSEGGYSFDYLREGSYCIAAGGPIFGGALGLSSSHGRQIQSPIRVAAEEQRTGVDFRLEAGGDILGQVIDPEGRPVEGASIFVRDERGRLVERFTLTSSAANGAFEYLALAPGTYTVSAHAGQLASGADASVSVRAGKKSRLKLPLVAGTMLVILLEDAQNPSAAGARLSVTNAAGHELTGMFNLAALIERHSAGFRSGEYLVGPLPAGTYSVLAESRDGRSKRTKVKLSDRGRDERPLRLVIP